MRRLTILVFAMVAPMAGLRAQVISAAPEDAEVVIYRGPAAAEVDEDDPFGLAMITETRTIDLPAGPTVIKFQGVAEAIVPQTAKLEGLPTPIVESNFDYDLLSPGALIAKSVGTPVRVVRTNRDTGTVIEQRAVLRSGPHGVVLEADGRIEALGCSGMDERLVFDTTPANLADQPTLSMSVNVPAGRYKVRLSYLTLGMNWAADYVAQINPDGRTLELTGWITLTNKLASSYRNVPVKVIAGELSFYGDETVPPAPRTFEQDDACWPVGSFYQSRFGFSGTLAMDAMPASAPMMMRAKMELEDVVVTASNRARQSELGDYKLYTLPERTTVAANQTKQVRMVDKSKVPFERVYVHRYYARDADSEEEEAPMAVLRLQNKTSAGLGVPLPAGIISVMEPSARHLVLAGEKSLQDTPVNLPIDVELGPAMDVWVRPRVVSDESIDGKPDHERVQIEITMGNDKPVPIRLEFIDQLGGEEDWHIVSESKRHELKLGNRVWSFSLQPGARQVLRYTFERAK